MRLSRDYGRMAKRNKREGYDAEVWKDVDWVSISSRVNPVHLSMSVAKWWYERMP